MTSTHNLDTGVEGSCEKASGRGIKPMSAGRKGIGSMAGSCSTAHLCKRLSFEMQVSIAVNYCK